MDQFHGALQQAALFRASGLEAAVQQKLEELQRETEGKRQSAHRDITALLDAEKAKPDPNPTLVALFTKSLKDLERL